MKMICPYCETQREIEAVEKNEKVNVRGESIDVLASHYHCPVCRGDFEDPKKGFDFLEKAYEDYRRRHGLTQGELSKLLGWGPVTLSRYENGALPDEVHDKMLRLAMNPENLMRLIKKTPEAVPERKRKHLLEGRY